jgi:TolB-like protein/Flp pilus assembly protein TadD
MQLLEELKRRNVIRVAIGYVAVSWLVLQAGTLIFGLFDLPNTLMRGLLALLAIGFIPALVFAWVYELTPEGLKRTSEVETTESIAHLTGRKLDFLVIGVLGAIVALLLVDKFVVTPRQAARVASHESAAASSGTPVSAAEGTGNAPAAAPIAASIAVLPFVDMSQAKDQEYFSDGLSEELLDLLAKVPQLKVIARTSSFSFKGKDVDIAEIAKKLAVATVLEGSVRKSGNTLRVTAQLIRTADSTHLWSDTYDRELTDVFKVQDEIAAAVVSALKLKLLPSQTAVDNARRTSNIEAYNQFLLGKEFFKRTNREDWHRAEAAFRQALALEPNYAPAWAGLGLTQAYLSDFAVGAEAVAAAKRDSLASAEKAIALAPDLADGYDVRSFLRYSTLRDWEGARADLDRLSSLDPNSAVVRRRRAGLLAAFGHLPEAIVEIHKAIDLDPLAAIAWTTLGQYQLGSGDYAAAREALKRALELNPKSSFAVASAGMTELLDGRTDAASAMFKSGDDIWSLLGIALVEHTRGHARESQDAIDRMIREYSDAGAYQIAEACSWRGEEDQAFQWLERAYVQRDGGTTLVKYDPFLKSLRTDSRYAAFLKKMGLPQ